MKWTFSYTDENQLQKTKMNFKKKKKIEFQKILSFFNFCFEIEK